MADRIRIDWSTTPGRVMLYEASDDAPWADPFGYRSRVHFNSDWRYPRVVKVLSDSVELPAISAVTSDFGTIVKGSISLGSHGLGAVPLLVEGRWKNVGSGAPAAGSVPVQGGARWVTLGADATTVWVHWMGRKTSTGTAAITLTYDVYLADWQSSLTPGVMEWRPEYFTCGDFDSRWRYIQAIAGGNAFAAGETLKHMFTVSATYTIGNNEITTTYNKVTFHYAVPGFFEFADVYLRFDPDVIRDPGTPAPIVKAVTI